jgi:DNA-directed RNA polymerase specialized sigma24 family protein
LKYPTRNANIALQLIAQFKGLINAISYRMGVRYHLSDEDRQDLVAAVQARIATVRWRKVLIHGHRQNLNNYTISLIQNTMIKEVRRIKARGLSGLSKGPAITAFPQHDDGPPPDVGADGLPDRVAAREIAERARAVLTPAEWDVLSLLHGFDGGGGRTSQQVARELDLPRSRVENLIESGLQKVRRSMGVAVTFL